MSSQKPFEITRWEAPHPPTIEFLMNWLQREGLSPAQEQLEPGTQSVEMKYTYPMLRTVLTGNVQCSFPGYGVVELKPGDCVEIQPDTLHDLKVMSREPVALLNAPRQPL